MADYLRLTDPPRIFLRRPFCGVCSCNLDHTDGAWTCPSCGTSWPLTACDGWPGELPADATGPEVTAHEAWVVGELRGAERQRRLDEIRAQEARRG